MNLRYRKMVADDISAVLAVRVSTVENAITIERLERDYEITPRSLAEAMRTDVAGWLCEDSGSAVGFSMGDRSKGEVQVVAVRPEYEGHGIGKALLHRVREWLFSQGHDAIWLRSNPDPTIRAYGFYRRLGWRATGRTMGDDEVLVLEKAGS